MFPRDPWLLCDPYCAQFKCYHEEEIEMNPTNIEPEPATLSDVLRELDRALLKFPTWPTDPLHALAVLGEEFGELTKEVLQSVYEPHKSSPAAVRKEAIQCAAMAIRFVRSLDEYEYRGGGQHEQPRGCAACDRGDYSLGHAAGCAKGAA